MNTRPAAWDDVDPLSQWFAELFGGGPDTKPAPGADYTGQVAVDTVDTVPEPGDNR